MFFFGFVFSHRISGLHWRCRSTSSIDREGLFSFEYLHFWLNKESNTLTSRSTIEIIIIRKWFTTPPEREREITRFLLEATEKKEDQDSLLIMSFTQAISNPIVSELCFSSVHQSSEKSFQHQRVKIKQNGKSIKDRSATKRRNKKIRLMVLFKESEAQQKCIKIWNISLPDFPTSLSLSCIHSTFLPLIMFIPSSSSLVFFYSST